MRKQLVMLAAALFLPSVAAAQVEISLEAGYRFGGLETEREIFCIAVTSPCPTSAKTDDDSLIGLTVGFPLGRQWAVELHASRQETDLALGGDFLGLPALLLPADAEITVVEGDLVRRFEVGNWQPFAGGGIGVARLQTDPTPVIYLDEEVLTANLVAGARYAFSPHLGLRLAGRARWLDLPSEVDGDELTLETSAGISFRL